MYKVAFANGDCSHVTKTLPPCNQALLLAKVELTILRVDDLVIGGKDTYKPPPFPFGRNASM